MRYLVGSHFWGSNIPTSDKDYVQIVAPTRVNLWDGNMVSSHVINNNEDYTFKDIRMLLRELRKGAVNAFTILYADLAEGFTYEQDFMKLLKLEADALFDDLKGHIIKQIQGELRGLKIKLECACIKDDEEKIVKLKTTIVKLFMIANEINKGNNPFKGKKFTILRKIRTEELELDYLEVMTYYSRAMAIDADQFPVSLDLLNIIDDAIMDMIFYAV